MLRYCVKSTSPLKRLRADKDGMVSFEYVIVAACVIAAAGAAFGANAGGIATALTSAVNTISTAVAAAVGS